MITVLPGGIRINLDGYLPRKTCLGPCSQLLPAAEFIKSYSFQDGRRVLHFGIRCLQCEPPPRDFPDLHGARLAPDFLDDHGVNRGWRQRTRQGPFGDELSLECLGLRRTKDGVFRPQPKLDRRSTQAIAERPRRVVGVLARPPAMIYFRQEIDDRSRVKIGKGHSRRRQRQTRSTDNPRELITLLCIPERPDCTEKLLHQRFARWRCRKDQEWFFMSDEIRAFIEYEKQQQHRMLEAEEFQLR